MIQEIKKRSQGRPHKKIDKRTFEKLCALQCRKEEMAEFFECDEDTLNNWCKREYGKVFSAVFGEKRVLGYVSLRRAQYQKAVEDRNPAMLIFLGKNWLDQSDRQEVKLENPIPVETSYDLSALSEEELLKLREILKKAKKNGKTTNASRDRSRARKNPAKKNPKS